MENGKIIQQQTNTRNAFTCNTIISTVKMILKHEEPYQFINAGFSWKNITAISVTMSSRKTSYFPFHHLACSFPLSHPQRKFWMSILLFKRKRKLSAVSWSCDYMLWCQASPSYKGRDCWNLRIKGDSQKMMPKNFFIFSLGLWWAS